MLVLKPTVYAELMTGVATSPGTAGTLGATRAAALRANRLLLAHDQGLETMSATAAKKIMQWHGDDSVLYLFSVDCAR